MTVVKTSKAICNGDHHRAQLPFNQALPSTEEDKPVCEEPHEGATVSTQNVTVSPVRMQQKFAGVLLGLVDFEGSDDGFSAAFVLEI
ncbi:hypothetical protein Patl1_20482 [Pistacia atlantica]|uniref:Uncharacterized protein n=1 Tax=Pistacia atlantica TaxID=434234 RepID=A0ACC1BM08_9ROSI|nr:hypothetical protein Patl1_20482 [Pistacia atlantica]